MAGKIKSLAGDTIIYGGFTIVGRFLTFMLTPLYTNFLSVPENGAVKEIFSILAFINILFSFGMESAFFRFYSKDDISQSRKAFTLAFGFIFSLSLTATLLFIFNSNGIVKMFPSLKADPSSIRLVAFIPFLDALTMVPFALLRLQRQARKFAYIRLFMIILAVALNFLFIVILKYGINGVFMAQALSSLAGAVYFLPTIRNYLLFKFDKKLFKEMLLFGLPTLPANFSAIILQVGDRPILKFLTNEANVGIYSVNYSLGIVMMLVVSVFDYAWKPFYLTNFTESDAKKTYARVFTYFTLVCSFIFLISSLFLREIVKFPFIGGKFINPQYWTGLGIVPIILGAYYFNGVYLNFAAGFNIEKKTKYLAYTVGLASVINVILNFLLIPIYGIWGAAWATFVAYFISAVLIFYYQRKVYPINYEWKRIISIISLASLIYFPIYYISPAMGAINGILLKLFGMIVFIMYLIISDFFDKDEKQKLARLFKLK
ncbi:MAG: polysaccharide biosynthesis C-terminal domain-containing protein [Candidatus Kapabacteria bacterium]|nr:polysaccharide biosynthesis C-terminal domain-containing protein [Candidatus Kapabacteria bacterium]